MLSEKVVQFPRRTDSDDPPVVKFFAELLKKYGTPRAVIDEMTVWAWELLPNYVPPNRSFTVPLPDGLSPDDKREIQETLQRECDKFRAEVMRMLMRAFFERFKLKLQELLDAHSRAPIGRGE